MNFASCNKFNGKVTLDRNSNPYSTICSGYNFVSNGLDAQKITPGSFGCVENLWDELINPWETEPLIWDAPGCFVRDFLEERTPFIRGNICQKHPLADIKFERKNCTNRFGGAILQEIGNPSNIREAYDESCVGYLESGTNKAPLTNRWESSSLGFFRGTSVNQSISIPSGQCVGTEPDYKFTRSADSSNCGGFNPCYELLNSSCVFDGNPSSPVDPACNNKVAELPESIFRDTLFCSTNPSPLNQRRNTYCSAPIENIRVRVNKAKYCNTFINDLRIEIKGAQYCSTDISLLKTRIEKASYCSTDASFIRPQIVIQQIAFCSLDRDTLKPQVAKIKFCSTSRPIGKADFCSYDAKSIRNLSFVEYCSADVNSIRVGIDKAEYCEHNQVNTLLFAPQARKTIDGIQDITLCSLDRKTISGVDNTSFCSYDAKNIRNVSEVVNYCSQNNIPNLLFSNQDRKVLDFVDDLLYCKYNRRTIDGAETLEYCSINRKNLDNIDDLSYCSYERKNLSNVETLEYCSIDINNLNGISKVNYCEVDKDNIS